MTEAGQKRRNAMAGQAHLGRATLSRVGDFAQTNLLTCAPDTPVAQAAALMRERACSSVLVVEGTQPVGIWTESDAARTDFSDPAAFDAPIRSVMSGPLATIAASSEAGAAVLHLREERIRHLVVVDDAGTPVGIVTQTDLTLRFGMDHFLRLRMVGEIIGNLPLRLPGALVASEAARCMTAAGRDAAIVERQDGILGILTERDLLGLVARRQAKATLSDLASFPLRTVPAGQSLLEARRLLIDEHIRHLGVTDVNGAVVALLSLHDILEMLERTYATDLAEALRQRDEELLHSLAESALTARVLREERELIAAGPIVVFKWSPAEGWPVIYVSSNVAQVFGYRPEDLLANRPPFADLVHPDDLVSVAGEVAHHLASGTVHFQQSYRLHHADGGWRWIDDYTTVVRNSDGDVQTITGYVIDVTERVLTQESLRHSEERFSQAFRSSPLAASIARAHDGCFIDANDNYARDFGWHRDELIGRTSLDVGLWPDEESRNQWLKMLKRDGRVVDWETTWRHRNGEFRRISMSAEKVEIDGERCILAYIMDITQRKQAEETLQLAASVFSHAREGIMITTPDSTIVEVNDAFSRITGYHRDEVIGHSPRLLRSDRHGPEFYARMWRTLGEIGYWSGELWNRRKDGTAYAELLTISAVHDAEGVTRHFVALFSDITEQKEHQQQLERIAHYDALTGLPNRVLLADRMHQALVQAKRRGQQLAVAYIDLDGFKAINDNHGHEAGDQLLMVVAGRMKQCLREGDTIARLGGDEFVAVLVDIADIQSSVPLIIRLLDAAAQPVSSDGLILQVSASIGVSFRTPAEDIDADQLLRQSDQAMYQAKLAGKNRYHVFDAEQDRNVRGHHESIEHIRQGLADNEFVLYYQPKVNLRSGTLVGAEALIRWQHPERGLLAPGLFLHEIENHPLGVALGEWVIGTALAQIETWQRAGLELPVSVNIAAYHLQQPDFVARLRLLLDQHPAVSPTLLELEVLETSALEDIAHVSAVITACAQMGVGFALDDFGTGYSSLTYLKRLPARVLKIDQSFVRDMLDDPDDLAILDGVLGLANSFGREAIAEGVETVAHGETLLRLGCELAQGYGIARPMPAADLPAWRDNWRPDPVWARTPLLGRDFMPALFAGVEHRAWVRALDEYLQGMRDAPPALDQHQCRFGQWLDKVLPRRKQRHAAIFASIETLHRQVHALAINLLDLARLGRNAEARTGLTQVYELRDSLQAQLRRLIDDS
jgi:diguanylate cyclase (GGDEF)-like protein/PAS domain S-box-containing protein